MKLDSNPVTVGKYERLGCISSLFQDIKLTKSIPKWPNCLHSQSFLPLELVISLHPAVSQAPNRSDMYISGIKISQFSLCIS